MTLSFSHFANFNIPKDSILPWLEVVITQSGIPQFSINKPVDIDCVDPVVHALNLTDATDIEFKLFKCDRISFEVTTTGTAEFVDKSKGVVRYKWSSGDTAIDALYYGQFNITFPDGLFIWPSQKEMLAIGVNG